ncbi:hypothetical protein M422DRAFT_775679 [Sphaerobolus stellatus SS14]|nr:hypothetical protein M422DRAFT_775679 [Sphaerobolus stellatus SS14]
MTSGDGIFPRAAGINIVCSVIPRQVESEWQQPILQNKKIGKVVVVGGSSTRIARQKYISQQSSYMADTFPFDPEYTSWKQVISPGFQPHRSHSHLISDTETGRIFLFGGTTFDNSATEQIFTCLNDLWELILDICGGNFEEVDLEEEARNAPAANMKWEVATLFLLR